MSDKNRPEHDSSKAPASPGLVVTGRPGYYAGPVKDISMPGDIDIRRLMRLLREKWMTIAAVLVFSFVAAVLYLLIAQKTYRAVTLIELSVRRPRIAGQQGAVIDDAYSDTQSEEIFNTWLERFKSRTMLEAAMVNLRTAEGLSRWSDEKLRKLMQRYSDIVLIRRSRLVQVSFEYSDPKFAASAANAFADAAVAIAFEENKTASENAVTWLQSQAQVQRKELEKADKQLGEFRSQNHIDALDSQKKSVEESLLAFNKALVDIESQEVLARDLVTTLSRLELKPENAGRLPASIPRGIEVQTMLEKWLAAISERDALLTKYTEKHPAVVAQNKVVDVLHDQAMDAIKRVIATAESNLNLLDQQAESLTRKMADQRRMAAELELEIVDLKSKASTLERAREAADISYKGILNRIEEARLSADETTATVKIVERAAQPERPIRPRKLIVLLVWLSLGLVGGIGMALLTDILEDYITGPADIEIGVGLSILALVPSVKGANRESLATACMTDKFGQFAEAFAGIRGALDSSKYKAISHTVLISSTAPDEGKTVAACNLAIMCAKSGTKTLLIDFDMRRPHMYKLFGMPENHPSLIHVLSAQDASVFSSMPFQSACAGLDVIGGRLSSDLSPAEIIGSRVVRDFIRWAAKNYDRVVIDAPPFSVVSDPMVLADIVNCVIMVCRVGQSRKRAIRHAVSHLRETGATVIGAVVNGVDFQKGLYGGDYENYHGYYNYHKYMKDSSAPDNAF